MPQLLTKKDDEVEAYQPSAEEKEVLGFLGKRIPIIKDSKKKILEDFDFEELMRDADKEYLPNSLREKKDGNKSVMLVQDDVKGLRGSRIVPITGKEGTEWRSDVSEPTLLVKVQTALSILVDQNPEAVFKAVLEKYKPASAVAKAIWKRSWGLAKSKDQLKLFILDLAKYGWAIGRTYPRLVQRDKEILTELDIENPEKNKYKKVKIIEFNDIWREKMDPFRTWIDDKTNLTDPWSQDDWYFELDYSRDDFYREFGQYSNSNKVKFGQIVNEKKDQNPQNNETRQRSDMITLGFYESKNKDLYSIWSPKDKVIVYYSPLPNDEGMLSCWWAPWNVRDARTPYGIGLFEIIKNNKLLYDRLDNMDMDQLVLSIYTMLFYSGTNAQIGDGSITISPGVFKQKLPGTSIDQVKISYDGKGREGASLQRERIDEISGITPTLQGQVEGKTLGEVLHAKDAALKRLNIPLANIASAIESDAYLTLSWGNQVYSLPEVMEFVDQNELQEYMNETGRSPESTQVGEDGSITADMPRVLDLSLEQTGSGSAENREGVLIESPESRFFVVGKDIQKTAMKWKGQITVEPQSIISPSEELDRQRKMELFNLVTPVVQFMAGAMEQGQYDMALAVAKPVNEILEIQNEKPEDWLPDDVVRMLNDPKYVDQLKQKAAQQQQQMADATASAAKDAEPLFVNPNAPPQNPNVAQGPANGAPQIPTSPGSIPKGINPVAPTSSISNPVKKTLSEIGKVK